ncbi:hypothetical protein M3P05_00010 [Sansalvadorimonas sp. 2012CJ34-2]|uniref:Toprim domain-containing protein n=1 Tax=Parendozoicomonas callyspongiae TaxID=2942213 RepID=A0ABT0PAF3_9GAMM|nr:hypothetical protein [Sansalvadorimonas sp. 2012CJ34-2]MCL6268334.1 hypothetical protein [Sansalvadorimonas sp. 2012CJ34-2]
MTAYSSYLDDFINATFAAGIPLNERPIADGKFHRYPEPHDKSGRKSAYYALHFGRYPFGIFGSFKGIGQKHLWRPFSVHSLSDEERLELAIAAKHLRESIRRETARVNDETAKVCQDIWRSAREVSSHPYLDLKAVPSYGLKVIGQSLLIPVCNVQGELRSIQFICPDNENGGFQKRFKKGGQIQGCGFRIGNFSPTGTNAIAEGYATAASVYVDKNVASVFAAFHCGNLLHAGLALRDAYQQSDILFAADNDRYTPGNPGILKALQAAERVNGRVTYPQFPAGCSGTDFNDYANLSKGVDRG